MCLVVKFGTNIWVELTCMWMNGSWTQPSFPWKRCDGLSRCKKKHDREKEVREGEAEVRFGMWMLYLSTRQEISWLYGNLVMLVCRYNGIPLHQMTYVMAIWQYGHVVIDIMLYLSDLDKGYYGNMAIWSCWYIDICYMKCFFIVLICSVFLHDHVAIGSAVIATYTWQEHQPVQQCI